MVQQFKLALVVLLCAALFSCTKGEEKAVYKAAIFIGYSDARPASFVGDRYERQFLIGKLTRDCRLNQSHSLCGFKRDIEDENLFVRDFKENAVNLHVELRLESSSAGFDDNDNRSNPYQAFLSKNVEGHFFTALNTDDLIIYIGHSRDGGGPDFSPPKINERLHVDYAWYRAKKPGFSKLAAELSGNSSKKKRSLLFLSCFSSRFFTASRLGAKSGLEVRGVQGLIYYKDALEAALSELSRRIDKLSSATAGNSAHTSHLL